MVMNYELTTADSILALFETTKEQRESFVRDVVRQLDCGQTDPLKIHLQIKAMSEIIERLTDRKKYAATAKVYADHLLFAAQMHGKEFTYQNAKFAIRETGTAYDFSNCNDSKLNELQARFDALKAELDARKEYLKAVPASGITAIDETTGEVQKIYPPSKSSTTSVTVTLK